MIQHPFSFLLLHSLSQFPLILVLILTHFSDNTFCFLKPEGPSRTSPTLFFSTNASKPIRETSNTVGKHFLHCVVRFVSVATLSAKPASVKQETTGRKQHRTGGTAQRDEHTGLVTHRRAQQRGSKQQHFGAVGGGGVTHRGHHHHHHHYNHHDRTLRASDSILSSSFSPSRPPWIFSGLSSTSTLLVYGSNLTEKGRLMLAT